jgi:hypothetical protein
MIAEPMIACAEPMIAYTDKIEPIISPGNIEISHKQMKVIPSVDTTLLCGVLDFSGKKYYLDFSDFNKFILEDKRLNFINNSDVYPSYLYNYKRFSLLEVLFSYNSSNIKYVFKNNNPYDLRGSNVEIYHHYHEEVKKKYAVIEYIQGHYLTVGNDAYVLKNPMWRILNEQNEEVLLMYCETNTLCILSAESYEKILDFEKLYNNGKKLTFYKHQNGYIGCASNLYIHQIITDCRGNGKGTKNISVDHIDRNPLNNTITNLRIASRSDQEQNTKGISEGTKRERKSTARALPEGLTQQMMMKYVVYYNECYNKEKNLYREFFKVEKHPKLDKHWMSSKSNKISLMEKLASTNKVVTDLENDVYPFDNTLGNTTETALPTYITIKQERNKPHLVFDKKSVGAEEKRLNLRMVLPDNYILEEQMTLFREKIKEKYDLVL